MLPRALRRLFWHEQPVDFTRLGEFKYKRIANAREIRVLVLDPGTGDDEVSCSLKHVSLDSSPRFEALSYAWGDAAQRQAIKCADGILRITLNLHCALRHIRYRYRKRILWTDAICINQNDFDERAEQVKLMADIYSTGYRTLIWLGEDTGDVSEAFSSIKWTRRKFPRQSPLGFLTASEVSRLQKKFEKLEVSRPLEVFLESKLEPLVRLLSLSWFQRKWVIQEVVKGKQPRVLCGNFILDWHILEDTFMYLKLFQPKFLTNLGMRNVDSLTVINHVTFIAVVKSENQAFTLTLSTLLYVTRSFKCSDTRDHLIALLGLANDTNQDDLSIRADYKISVAELSKEYVLWEIFQKGSLECFSSGYNQQTLSPSWVPDFMSWPKQLGKPRQYMGFNATQRSQLCATLSEDKMGLSLEGKLLDEIEILRVIGSRVTLDQHNNGTNSDHHVENISLELNEMVELQSFRFFQEYKAIALKGSAALSHHRLEGFYSSMLWDDCNDGQEKPSEALLENFEELVECGATPIEEGDAAWLTRVERIRPPDLFIKFDIFSIGRHFSETRNGRLGSMPEGTKVGDKICIFYGGNLPYVIRPCGNSKYTLIGDCYVHGLMYGEAMDMVDIKTETIHLV